MVAKSVRQARLERISHAPYFREQVFVEYGAHDRQSRGASDHVAHIGLAVTKLA